MLRWRRVVIDPLAQTSDVVQAEIDDVEPERRAWLRERIAALAPGAAAARRALYERLVTVEVQETFLAGRFPTTTRFSLEGCDALLPLVDAIVDASVARGVDDVLVGCGHRGRLALLVGLGCWSREEVLALCARTPAAVAREHGDVRYHLGGRGRRRGATVELVPSPSHVSAVHPVVVGRVRARQDARGDRRGVLAILLHGDGAFVGQGVTAELLNLARLDGYTIGGAIHVIVNNQIAFTTRPRDGRSTPQPTDLARMLRAPILHVSADAPDTVAAVGALAAEYRATHGDDIFLDLVGYRRRGHNEGDEPRFTLPALYRAIDAHPPVCALHAEQLVAAGIATRAELEATRAAETSAWRAALDRVTAGDVQSVEPDPPRRRPAAPGAVSLDRLVRIAARLAVLPPGFAVHPKLGAAIAERAARVAAGQPIDLAAAETLALATLAEEGVAVRLSGQDARRGTFAQRHAVLVDQITGASHSPLAELGRFAAWDSPLAEGSVLAFEYGYSVDAADALVLWEAQYGDFANGAQVAIDQFVTSGEAKWGQRSSVAMLLPHGHEGQGPEHSSARLERWLELCACNNMRVCQPTTAAQLFHLLRSQVAESRPLVVLMPKSLLRSPRAASPPTELAAGGFAPVLDDVQIPRAARVILCSGRLYYELLAARPAGSTAALVRLEQLYPLAPEVGELVRRRAAPITWVQEEPRNLGAWRYVAEQLGSAVTCVSRPESPAPAGGSIERHRAEQAQLIAEAFA